MKNPAAFIEAVRFVISSGLAFFVIMGWVPMTPDQQAAAIVFGNALLGVVGTLVVKSQTTPLIEPKDIDGTRLVRSDQTTPILEKRSQLKSSDWEGTKK